MLRLLRKVRAAAIAMAVLGGCAVSDAALSETSEAVVAPLFPQAPIASAGPAAAIGSGGAAKFNGWGWQLDPLAGQIATVRYPLLIPRRARLTGWQVYVYRAALGGTTSAVLQCQDGDGAHWNIGAVGRNDAAGIGAASIGVVFPAPLEAAPDCVAFSLLVMGGVAAGDTAIGVAVFGSAFTSMSINALSGSGPGWGADTDGCMQFNNQTAGGHLLVPLPLPEGATLTSLRMMAIGDGSADIAASVFLVSPSMAKTQVGVASMFDIPALWREYTVPISSGAVVASGSGLILDVDASVVNPRIGTISVEYR